MSQGFVNPYTYATSAPTITKYTSGSGTYTTPAGVKFLVVEMVGGGGGGAGSSSVSNGGTGGTGGTTTFGTSLFTCTGGSGGTGANPSVGGAGGAATLNSPGIGINLAGQQGEDGQAHGGYAINQFSGSGGSTPFAGAGSSVGSSSTAIAGRTAIANTGSGGSGAAYNQGTSGGSFWGAGGGAGAYINAVITSPSATYAYAVGAAGTAGTAGTAGSAGGAGAAGIIIISEYYEVLGIPTTLTLPLPVANGGTGVSSPTIVQATATGTTQTIPQASPVKITLANEVYDTNNNFSSSTFTASVAGYYYVYGQITISLPNNSCALYTFIYKNGSQFSAATNLTAAVGSTQPFTTTNFCQVYLNAGDTVELYGYQVNGTSSAQSIAGDSTYLSIYKMV